MSAEKEKHRRALGEQLRRVRENNQLSQTELGKIAGINPSSICDIEAGRRPLGVITAKYLASALGVDNWAAFLGVE